MSALTTGLKVAAADALLEGHPSLKAGAIAGIVMSGVSEVVDSAATRVLAAIEQTATAQAAATEQLAEQAEQHAKDQAHAAAQAHLREWWATEEKKCREAELSIADTSQDYKLSLEVMPDDILLAVVKANMRVSKRYEPPGYSAEFNARCAAIVQRREEAKLVEHLPAFRMAATYALGLDHDYMDDLALTPKMLNAIRREFLQRKAAAAAEHDEAS